ncbi:hypothetical protein VNI00_016333 [Paramarasmius palmivorus]|uniref:Fungal-type protein kinase domain-containing protein n=1 Tax=Paramarasmius palmivorus TaxID=297713 RepID=A0AAW0BEJ6_9AGAR
MVALVEETRSIKTASETKEKEKVQEKKEKKGKDNEQKEQKEKEDECDVVLAAEFKTKVDDGYIDDNVSKALGNVNLNHITGTDPTRRFVYGMTIEHTNIRLWLCSRSHIFVT